MESQMQFMSPVLSKSVKNGIDLPDFDSHEDLHGIHQEFEDEHRSNSTWYYHPALKRQAYFRRKYIVERLIGFLLLVLTAPIILVAAILVKLTSPGPALYRQTRFGFQGKTYDIIKLRTMRIDAEADGVARWCSQGDPRITTVGKFLRKTHLDELPQLVNVVKGEMVLVGPRPERPVISRRLSLAIDGYFHRLAVKPGITGLAQINLPPDQSDEDALRKQVLDLQYIREANLWLDIRMITATAAKIFGISGHMITRNMRLCRKSLITDPFHGLTRALDTFGHYLDHSETTAYQLNWQSNDFVNRNSNVSASNHATPRHPR